MLSFWPSAYAAQRLVNPSIETYHDYQYPRGWDFKTNDSSTVTRVASEVRTGSYALKFDLSLADGPEWVHTVFPVRPGEQYKVSFWYRVDQKVSTGHVAAFARWWDDAQRSNWLGQEVIADQLGASVTSGWVLVEKTLTVPAGVTYSDVEIWGNGLAFGPQGIILVDDFSYATLPSSSPPVADPVPEDGQEQVGLYQILQWSTQPSAASYRLYLGTEYHGVLDADESSELLIDTLANTASALRYAMTLKPYHQYYWRVDGVDAQGQATRGDVWSFATAFDLFENAADATQTRYGAKDNLGATLDGLKIIDNPGEPGYIGVHHTYRNGEFEMRLVTSSNLYNWRHRTILEPNADMPAIVYHPATGGFFMVHEQWGSAGSSGDSNLRFRYYASYADLLAGNDSKSYLAPFSPWNNSNLEGTPNFFSISEDGDRIEVGFHYFKVPGSVDRNARGVLTGFMSGTPSWSAIQLTDLDDTMLAYGLQGNIGDRDWGRLFGRDYLIEEGQYLYGDFGSWRAWVYDDELNDFLRLVPRTDQGSLNYGNMTFTWITSPAGRPAVVCSYFVFGEQAAPGEGGPLIFYNEIQDQASEPWPEDGQDGCERSVALRWLAGAGVQQHRVWLSSQDVDLEAEQPSAALLAGQPQRPVLTLDSLALGATYYWRVDEVDADGRVSLGSVWSFTVRPSTVARNWDTY